MCRLQAQWQVFLGTINLNLISRQIRGGRRGILVFSSAFDARASIEEWEPTSARSSRLTSMFGRQNRCRFVASRKKVGSILTCAQSIQKWGNRLANLYWESHLKPGHIPPEQCAFRRFSLEHVLTRLQQNGVVHPVQVRVTAMGARWTASS
jgi:hypothetical protein